MATIKLKDSDGNDKYYEVVGAGTAADPYKSVTTGQFSDSSNIDAFGRLRVSNPKTLFDSKQLHDNMPLFWDDSEVSGATTTSTHSVNTASSTMGVAATTAGRRVRQTFMRFNYQPGKSQLVYMTGTLDLSGGGTGITRSFGIYDDDNGIFLKDDEGTYKVVCRTSTSGSPVDVEVAQASWNLDVMDGTGLSGVTLDYTKSQLLVIDYEWLSVGRVRMGFIIDGVIVYVHQFVHANILQGAYMSTPNLPLRYEIENDGTGAASTLEHICSTVISEGGADELGKLGYVSTGGTHVDANAANTVYAVVGIRLKSTHLDAVVKQISVSLLAETSDDFEWIVLLNPTVASTFTYSGLTNYGVDFATGATANTVTNGTALTGGWAVGNSGSVIDTVNAKYLGSAIDGTPDEIVLCVRPLSANLDIQGSVTFRELS